MNKIKFGLIAINMKVNGRMVIEQVMVSSIGPMEKDTKENGWIIKEMVKVLNIGLMVIGMKENGIMIN